MNIEQENTPSHYTYPLSSIFAIARGMRVPPHVSSSCIKTVFLWKEFDFWSLILQGPPVLYMTALHQLSFEGFSKTWNCVEELVLNSIVILASKRQFIQAKPGHKYFIIRWTGALWLLFSTFNHGNWILSVITHHGRGAVAPEPGGFLPLLCPLLSSKAVNEPSQSFLVPGEGWRP